MGQFVRNFLDGYHDIMDNKSDPRVNNWLLMSSPFPTLAICLSYVYFVKVLGPKIMDSRKPMNLRSVLIVYNFVQVIFSAWLFYEALASGWWFDYSFRCQPVDYSKNLKALRIFFVVRKKNEQITNLHVIHHGIMPMSVWFGVKFTPGGHSTFFGMINTFVHTIMYTYYLFAAFGPRFQKYLWWKKYLTVLQMVQFVLMIIHSFQLLFIDCNYPKAFVWWIGLHAVLFYFLFSDFYKEAYKKKQASKQAISTATTQKEHDPQQEQNGLSQMDGVTLYEQNDPPPGTYKTEPRHRAFVKGVTMN